MGSGPAHDIGSSARRVAVWANNNFVGQTLKTDPLLQLDGHLTRDITETLWGRLTPSGLRAEERPSMVSRETSGTTSAWALRSGTINDNLGLTVGYKSTINDTAPQDLHLSQFTISLVSDGTRS
jgi:hypothetical protein